MRDEVAECEEQLRELRGVVADAGAADCRFVLGVGQGSHIREDDVRVRHDDDDIFAVLDAVGDHDVLGVVDVGALDAHLREGIEEERDAAVLVVRGGRYRGEGAQEVQKLVAGVLRVA